MTINKELLAPCGLYCGVCSILMAHRDQDQKFKERLAPAYGVSVEEIHCRGCLSDEVFTYCAKCPIRACTQQKGYEGCHQCESFPCEHTLGFPVELGKKVILRAVPQRREWGTEMWVKAEEARYRCPYCGSRLFRGAKRCRACKEPVDVD